MTKRNKPKTPNVKASPTVAKDLLSGFLQTLQDGFETDLDLETKEGVAFEYEGYGTFIMRRANGRNYPYNKAIIDKIGPYMRAKGMNESSPDDEFTNKLMAEIYTDTIIVGLKAANGEVIPYNDAAKKGLVNLFLAAPDLFVKIKMDALDAANFRKKKTEAEAKN